ncbi:MAG TPA: nucleotidyltransferase family protein [Burkholderiaceae bacterium]|nr:nucleotidyltransferase family protein [Burkholderiaceae bacterium]
MSAAPLRAAAACSAILLAAGRGERMRPLTDTCPKPLLPVGGKPLMQWPMEALVRGGVTGLVVNTAWLGEQISGHFGNSFAATESDTDAREALAIAYSHEGRDFGRALETAGGISRALPLLGDVFWVLAGDVFAPDFVFSPAAMDRFAAGNKLAHLWLVPNPAHNVRGDFGLSADGLALNQAETKYTYSTIGLYRRALFEPPWCSIAPGNPEGRLAPLAPLLRAAMDNGLVSAEPYAGRWADVGTPQRLATLNQSIPDPLNAS